MAKALSSAKEKYLIPKIGECSNLVLLKLYINNVKYCTDVILLLLILHVLPFVLSSCPDSCSCKWKKGKQTVICQNTQLTEIPDMLDTGTQVLDFTGNQLTVLPNDVFMKNHLVNLQAVSLPQCNINRIQKFALRSLTNLVKLDLSQNNLKFIPGYTFSPVSELR